MNLFVLTNTHSQFQHFLQEYRLREHFGNGGNREGQVQQLYDYQQLVGRGPCLVLIWGPLLEPRLTEIVNEVQARPDCVVVRVPLSEREQQARARWFKEAHL